MTHGLVLMQQWRQAHNDNSYSTHINCTHGNRTAVLLSHTTSHTGGVSEYPLLATPVNYKAFLRNCSVIYTNDYTLLRSSHHQGNAIRFYATQLRHKFVGHFWRSSPPPRFPYHINTVLYTYVFTLRLLIWITPSLFCSNMRQETA
jgi:hypothetical protein